MTTKPSKEKDDHTAGINPKYQWNSEKPRVLVFDVNETLINFESMNALFERIYGDRHVMREWLGHLIMYSMTLTLSGLYVDYFSLGQGLLEMVGSIKGVKVGPHDLEEIKTAMMTMPAHSDVVVGRTHHSPRKCTPADSRIASTELRGKRRDSSGKCSSSSENCLIHPSGLIFNALERFRYLAAYKRTKARRDPKAEK